MVGQNTIAGNRSRRARMSPPSSPKRRPKGSCRTRSATSSRCGKEKPHDRQEREALQDLPALSRTMRQVTPPKVTSICPAPFGGQNSFMRSEVSASEVVEAAPKKTTPRAPQPETKREPPPDVDADGAEALGRQFAKENRAIIDNPFPFGDTRRPRFDAGWRKETGSDGMGQEDDD